MLQKEKIKKEDEI
jgi:hypothetical protein